MEITGLELQEKIDNGDKLIIDLWMYGCSPCLRMKPIFEKVANENTSDVQMFTMDVKKNMDIAMSLGIRSVPTIVMFNGGNIVNRKVGVLLEHQINGLITEVLNG